MAEHAFLSASASHRWLNCPPSAKLCAEQPDRATEYAMEGTDAHTLCAYLVEKELGRDVQDPTENLSYYNTEMRECAEGYRDFVLEQIEDAKNRCADPIVLIEQKLDYSDWVAHGFGTGDCVIVSDGVLHIIDFKYGLGVLVSADDPEFSGNPQLMCYALGALSLYDGLYDISEIRMSIYQPRRSNVSTYAMPRETLLGWAENTLKPTALLASAGEGEFKAGDHCVFCKVKANCRKRAEYNLQLAKYDFQMPDTLDAFEIDAILGKADRLSAWVDDIREYALKQILDGTDYPSYKAVEGSSKRKYTDEAKIAEVVTNAGYNPYEQKLLGITAMTDLLGKKKFTELLDGLTIKPTGKPTLVPKSDKRPAIHTAKNDFKGE